MSGADNTSRNVPARSLHAGFTLLELVIAMAALVLLVAFAYPSYLDQMYKMRRTDALGPLLDVVNRQEQYMLDHKRYADNMTLLGYAANPYITPEGFYSVAVVTAGCGTAPCYWLTATPVSGKIQSHDAECTTFSINSAGNKTATGSASVRCW
jgi:type IV pilus assembly protein PilE